MVYLFWENTPRYILHKFIFLYICYSALKFLLKRVYALYLPSKMMSQVYEMSWHWLILKVLHFGNYESFGQTELDLSPLLYNGFEQANLSL